ncbi:MAG: hypothetical protein IJX82_09190 [Clostridia bacterium]|nr:hypothetical protein [Clostridia bacterium]
MNGKRKCKILKEIRKQIAKDNDIAFVTSECKHQGNCKGTCPKCEWEVRYLEAELEKRRMAGKQVVVAGIAAAMVLTSSCTPEQKDTSSKSSSEASSAESVCSPAESEWVAMGEEPSPESVEESVPVPGEVPEETSDEFWEGEIAPPEDSSEEEAIVGELLPEDFSEGELMGDPAPDEE